MSGPRRRTWDPVTVVLAGVLLVGAVAMGFVEATAPPLLEPGTRAPPFTLGRPGGPAVSSVTLEGQVTMVAFWASWCGPCRDELPVLVKVAREEGVALWAINTDDRFDQDEAVRRFTEDVPSVAPHVLLGVPDVGEAYQVRALPTLYVVGRDARIVAAHAGVADEAALRRWLRGAGPPAR